MKHLIQEIRELLQKPRLLLQYVILNFFLISLGVAAVVYTKKEMALEHARVQSEQIINTTEKLNGVDLPPSVERDVNRLQQGAETILREDTQTNPKAHGSSTK